MYNKPLKKVQTNGLEHTIWAVIGFVYSIYSKTTLLTGRFRIFYYINKLDKNI